MTKRSARPGNPLVAVAYLRCSTTEQHLSPEAQRAQIETWARVAGVSVVAWHCDSGVSGGADLGDRPALLAALAELRAVGAGVLACAKRDRLARDVVIATMVERAVKACGAKVQSADGTANGDTAADGFMKAVIDAAAAYERALIGDRTRRALATKKARGERIGAVPYGYSADAAGRLSPCEAEQGVLSVVRELRAAGLSQRAIVAALAERGLVSRVGRPFQCTQIVRMLAA
jgi:DNA invertase Pin-like site-specific DNA recombinase